jgi:hypothetical protein
MFVTNETTSPDLGSPIVSVSTLNPQLRPNEIDEQMERFSETSSIELIIQGGSYEQQPVRVPESHMMQFNHYPGSKTIGHVPVDIVKSFTPVLTNNDKMSSQDGAEIYSDYTHNPYNLTLRADNDVPKDAIPSASTVFQSSSYFSSDASDLIAPGSDIFNRP